jgi:hypothetical protein
VTELLGEPVAVRLGADGALRAVRTPSGWREVGRTTNRWLVETDWWRRAVRRDYRRCLTRDGECLEVYRDLEEDRWWLARRYD